MALTKGDKEWLTTMQENTLLNYDKNHLENEHKPLNKFRWEVRGAGTLFLALIAMGSDKGSRVMEKVATWLTGP